MVAAIDDPRERFLSEVSKSQALPKGWTIALKRAQEAQLRCTAYLLLALTLFLSSSVIYFLSANTLAPGVILSQAGTVALIVACLSGAFLYNVLWVWRDGFRIRTLAYTAMMSLEGQDGLLWRFRNTLVEAKPLDQSLTDETIKHICSASSTSDFDKSFDLLRCYWRCIDIIEYKAHSVLS